MNKISIILPVYNGEEYLLNCLDSIKKQSFSDFEVIMIDDCSTDSSSNIMKQFESADVRFKYFRNDSNQGLSFSRNLGMSKCSGDYLFFIDSDDLLNHQCIEKLYTALLNSNSDISICGFEMFSDKVNYSLFKNEFVILQNKELIREISLCERIHNFAWGKLYKKSLFDGIEFPYGRFFEDICTIPCVFGRANKGVFISDALYYYRQNANSITKTLNNKKIKDYFLSMEEKGNYILANYKDILKYMSQSFFELFMLFKEIKEKKNDIPNYRNVKHLYKLAVKKADLKQKMKYILAVL